MTIAGRGLSKFKRDLDLLVTDARVHTARRVIDSYKVTYAYSDMFHQIRGPVSHCKEGRLILPQDSL